MGVRVIRFILTLVLLASVSAFAGDGQTLYRQVATMSGESIPYAVHLPQEFDADVSYIIVDAQRFHSITGMVGSGFIQKLEKLR